MINAWHLKPTRQLNMIDIRTPTRADRASTQKRKFKPHDINPVERERWLTKLQEP